MPDDMNSTEKLADMVYESVRVYVDRKFAVAFEAAKTTLIARVDAAELDAKRIESALRDEIKSAPRLSIEDVNAAVAAAVAAIELPKGEPGAKGEAGEAGKDAVIDQAQIDAAVEKAVAAIEIVVPPAEPGPAGKDGINGKDAVVDYDAITDKVKAIIADESAAMESGLEAWCEGYIGNRVKAAVDAIPKPKDGEPGRDGRDAEGKPGRDAAEIAPIPMIHEERAYAQGTWARHLGGLWRAERDTDPIVKGDAAAAGWAVVVEGPARLQDIVLELKDDGRTLVFAFESSAGRIERSLSVPWPIDRGVWKPDRDYEKGDGATFNGSYWIAQAITKDRPGTSATWRLAVKAGRDGKDMRPNGTIERVPVRLTD